MYEFHGWFSLAQNAEESDAGQLRSIVDKLAELVGELRFSTVSAEIKWLNGECFLLLNGLANRSRDEVAAMSGVLEFVTRHLPGSFGILYERDDETSAPPGPNSFRVQVMARGAITERPDPFLSPCRPLIED
ncbi:Imm7 family immunity protein [Micromonospora rifamycinica]|uniref:Imm7 family immunity protein n=1 Tax=Micromonospora rifamycinica TaxID=291594 RepID=UPI003430537E